MEIDIESGKWKSTKKKVETTLCADMQSLGSQIYSIKFEPLYFIQFLSFWEFFSNLLLQEKATSLRSVRLVILIAFS